MLTIPETGRRIPIRADVVAYPREDANKQALLDLKNTALLCEAVLAIP